MTRRVAVVTNDPEVRRTLIALLRVGKIEARELPQGGGHLEEVGEDGGWAFVGYLRRSDDVLRFVEGVRNAPRGPWLFFVDPTASEPVSALASRAGGRACRLPLPDVLLWGELRELVEDGPSAYRTPSASEPGSATSAPPRPTTPSPMRAASSSASQVPEVVEGSLRGPSDEEAWEDLQIAGPGAGSSWLPIGGGKEEASAVRPRVAAGPGGGLP